MASENKYLNLLSKNTRFALIFLSLEFVLGMIVNLFAVSPDDPNYLTEPIYLKLVLPLHGIVGFILLIGTIALVFLAFKAGNAIIKNFTILGLTCILVAFGAGITTTMLKESQAEFSSLIMSLGFITSFLSYGKLYLLIKKWE